MDVLEEQSLAVKFHDADSVWCYMCDLEDRFVKSIGLKTSRRDLPLINKSLIQNLL